MLRNNTTSSKVTVAQAVTTGNPANPSAVPLVSAGFAMAYRRLEYENALLKRNLNAATLLQTQQTANNTENSYNELQGYYSELSQKYQEIQNALNKANTQNNILSADLKLAKKETLSGKKTLADKNAQITNFVKEIADLRENASSIEKANQKLIRKVDTITAQNEKIADAIDRVKTALDLQWGTYANPVECTASPQLLIEKALQVKAVIDYIHNFLWGDEEVPSVTPAIAISSTKIEAAASLTMLGTPTTVPKVPSIATSEQSLFNNSTNKTANKRKLTETSMTTSQTSAPTKRRTSE